mgnify:CR=1 FL=1
MVEGVVMSEPIVKYYKGKFSSQFSAKDGKQVGGQYKYAQIELEQRFYLKVERELTRDEYFEKRVARLSEASLQWQKTKHLRHVSHDPKFQIEPHILLSESNYIELERNGNCARELASELYVEFESDYGGNQYKGFEFIAFKDGLWHGKLEGEGYCSVPVLTDEELQKENAKIIERELKLQQNKGCMRVFAGASNNGCSPLALLRSPLIFGQQGGCASGGCGKIGCGLLGLLGLLALLIGLLKGCSDDVQKSQGPRVIHDTVYVDEKSKEDIIKKFMDTTTISKTEAIELPNVQFYTNSAKLLPYSISSIQQLAEYMNAHPNIHATIVGHTDNVGETQANLDLSQSRAETVKQVLLSFGVDGSRVEALGKGESQPRTTNDTVEGRALNRRVEVRLTKTEETKTESTAIDE